MHKIVKRIEGFLGEVLRPYWGKGLLPLPSNDAIRRHWGIASTQDLLDKRKCNLLANLIRHNALPRSDISYNGRVSWWNKVHRITGGLKITLEAAHDVTFWKHALRLLGRPRRELI